MRQFLFICTSLLLATLPLQAEDWPTWRGPSANGHSNEGSFPLTWSSSENVRWHTKLPGPGNSTPIVVGRRVFVTCASQEGRRRSLYCLDRKDGTSLWEHHVDHATHELTHSTNPYCSSSPVSDGQRVVVWHGSAGLFAYDIDGTVLWEQDLGQFEHIWGNASSPIIHEDLVILNCGPGLQSFMLAVDKRSGKQRWQHTFPGMAAKKVDQYVGSWSSPVVRSDDGGDSLIISLPERLYGLDPLSGAEKWSSGGLGKLVFTSPLVTDTAIVAMSGHQGPAIAVTPGGQGDVTDSHRIWTHDQKPPQRVGSGVVVDGCVYVLNEQGIAWCIELGSGDILWKQRLSQNPSWSNMCYARGRIYVNDSQATTYVLEPAELKCEVLAKNLIKERMGASLAFSDGQIFIRTHENLYCIEESK